MKCVLMSIHKGLSDTIFRRWTKRLEFRTRFNTAFKGRVYVYESGPEGGRVAGFFDTGAILTTGRDKITTEADWNTLEKMDADNLNAFFVAKTNHECIHAIEIKNVVRYVAPRTLKEWTEAMTVDGCLKTLIERPPQSWQYIEVDGEPYNMTTETVPLEVTEGEDTEGEEPSPTEEFLNKGATQ